MLELYQSSLDRRPVELAGFEPADDLIDHLKAR